jgi:hypothetical protein
MTADSSWSRFGTGLYIESVLRLLALFLAGIFLLGAFWAARDGSYPNAMASAHALLMLLCVVSPRRGSRVMLWALLIALALASVDFVVRALPGLRQESYPPDIVGGYVVEIAIVSWFLVKHFYRGPESFVPAEPRKPH